MSSESKKEGLKILLFMDLIFKTLTFVGNVSNTSLMRTLVIGDLDSIPPAVSIKLTWVFGFGWFNLKLFVSVLDLGSIPPAVSINLTLV